MTGHSLVEMRADHPDVESAILTGRIRQTIQDDPRRARYEIVGKACDLSTDVGVVVRLAGALLIITAYEMGR
jgi:hypothetical protein